MKPKQKTENLELVWKWGQHYRDQAEVILQESDANVVADFRKELVQFVASIESRWLRKNRSKLLNPATISTGL